ncbi:FAD-binding oxidoreductase [Haloarcula sp. S1CR25-12]|uniref:FAD-binding oxidoreductase n=1 Tax=Haloarcula saliterrae TaxID=2950534 RepID=A0ABU2FCL5_9EURY|nr:FAD-binding oxidoreductase [Haloarcula sp. S1CR25-12]MDS0259993.1 FAD-binding oxidoreductase [Haloarcula sp. S1CR25-12]
MTASGTSAGDRRVSDLSQQAIDDLRSGLRGDLLEPDDDGYDEARTVWNGMIDRHPALVVQCTGTADVVAAVEFARETGSEVSIHGGGHNVSGSAVADGGLMIDLSPMNGVHVDPEAGTVRAGGGALLGDVDHETQLFGLAAPLGVVSETGIAGLTLNGGYGHLSREYGLAADNLREVDIVTADGQVRTASEDRHADLFWAVRGGGGNFGVVTSLEYDLHEVGPEVSQLFVWYHADEAADRLAAFREWTESAPRTAAVLPFLAHVPAEEPFPEASWGEPALAFFGCVRGDPAAFEETVGPLTAGDPIVDLSERTRFEALQALLDEDYPDGLRYYWKSLYLTELTDEVVDVMVRYNDSAPSDLSTVDLWWLGGQVADVPQDATAFWHRDKPFMLNFEANWEDPDRDDDNVQWVREGFAAAEELAVSGGRYGNFPGFAGDPAHLLFGENYDRLVEVKTEYDPENLFRLNQNIAPRGTD